MKSDWKVITFGVPKTTYEIMVKESEKFDSEHLPRAVRVSIWLRAVIQEKILSLMSVARQHGNKVAIVTCSKCKAVFSGAVPINETQVSCRCLACICDEINEGLSEKTE